MLFLPSTTYDARVNLLKSLERGKVADDSAYQAMLHLDPYDYIALLTLGRSRIQADDTEGAKDYFWRALHAHPTMSVLYLELATLYYGEPESQSLAEGLLELALSRHDEDSPEPDYGDTGPKGEAFEEFMKYPAATRRQLFAQSIRARRTGEAAETTARLHELRLLQEMLANDPLDATLVDAIIAPGRAGQAAHAGENGENGESGTSMVPLLVGVLRDWAQDYLDEDGDTAMENAMALLGETAPATEIPHLLEFVELDHEIASGVAKWALARILERHPHDSVRLLTSLAPQMGPAERLVIAEQILQRPAIDPAGDLHCLLTQNLENLTAEDRNAVFPMLIGSLALARGPLGIRLGRKALEQQRGRLSKAVWRECDQMLWAAGDAGVAPIPVAPSPYNVYDICAGEAVWESEDEEPDDDEEALPEFLPEIVPEPVRRPVAPGRNDPCWCGSGKKYKKCHLDADEIKHRQAGTRATGPPPGSNEFAGLRRRLGAFPGDVLSSREIEQAAREFFGAEPGDEMMFVDWMLHDWIVPSLGRPVMDEYLIQHGSRLSARERQMVEAWSRSFVGLYEAQEVTPGSGVRWKDIHSGETMFVHDVSLSQRLALWDVVLARVVPGERGTEITGAALTVPRTSVMALREWIDEAREEAGLDWPEFAKRHWPLIRLKSFEVSANWMESLRLANTSGDELLISKAVYRVTDPVAVIEALRRAREFEDGSEHDSFVWLDKSKTLLGNIRIANQQLVIECNSRERLERGARLLSRMAGRHLEHLRDEFTSQEELRRLAKVAPATEPKENRIPKEISDQVISRLIEKHYREWPDSHLPALEGRTPREAVRTARGRNQVIEVLKSMENGEERKRLAGESFYDFSRLRAELGLE